MTFTSLVFLFFLPTVFCLYWLVGTPRRQNWLLIAASYIFYGYWDYRFCFLMLASSLVDYLIGWRLGCTEADRARKRLLLLSIACNLGLLGIFKYFNFFLDSFQGLAELFGSSVSTGTWNIVLPVGISFYTFQTLSYTIDIYRRRLEPTRDLGEYLAFVSFFPQLVAGPIERAARLLPQFRSHRKLRWKNVAAGSQRILWGFFKKIVIADTLADFVVRAYDAPAAYSGTELAIATVFFAFQIYCDFSAYSDIAIGTARLFDIRLMRNFAYPYFSQSMREFWQRWHVSLSTWFRDYVYIPLGGNRVDKTTRNRNIVLTFLLSGFWHGAAWQFLAWGGLHGVATMGTQHSRRSPPQFDIDRPAGQRLLPSWSVACRTARTFLIVCLLWVFFRAESFNDALLILRKFCVDLVNLPALQAITREYLVHGPLFAAVNLLLAFCLFEWLQRHLSFPLKIGHWPKPCRWVAYTTVFWFVVEYADKSSGDPFIYFQF